MINWQSILSSFDDKPTLLEWLKKVQKALNESALTTVTVTQEKADRVNSITLTFNFLDGTKIVAPAFTVNDGADGVDGVGITDIINTTLSAGKISVTYDTTDGITVFADMQQEYTGGRHVSKVVYAMPLMPGNGIVIDKKANAEKVVIKIDTDSFKTIFGNQSVVGRGNIDLYVHNMTFRLPDGDVYAKWISSNSIVIDSLTDLKTVFGDVFRLPIFGNVPKSGGVAIMLTETKLIMHDLDWNYSDFTIYDIINTI